MGNYFICCIIFCSPLIMGCDAQSNQADIDKLDHFFLTKDYTSYFNLVRHLDTIAFQSKDAPGLLRCATYLGRDFGEMPDSLHQKLRETAMYLAKNLVNLVDYKDALPVYLVAHSHVLNDSILDQWAWFIENDIFSIYTRLGDYEKADYFAKLTEASLIHFGHIDRLSRLYTNMGRMQKSINNLEGAIKLFERGYRLADSINYTSGVFANAMNLAEMYNDYPDMGLSEPYLSKASAIISLLRSDRRYYERKSSLILETARYKTIQGKCSEGIPIYKESIDTLRQFYPNTYRRDFAKYYLSFAEAYVLCDSLTEAIKTIQHGLHCLIPDYDGIDGLPQQSQLYAENAFTELLLLESTVFEKVYEQTGDPGILRKAIDCLNLALYANDLIRSTVIADPSKLVTIRGNKEMIEKGINIIYHLYAEDPSEENFLTARSMFNRSKSLLYGEKSRKNLIAQLMNEEERLEWDSLQKLLLDLHESKHTPQADINAINGEILAIEEKIDKIFDRYDQSDLNTRIPADYIEYFVSDNNIYGISSLNSNRRFANLGPKDKWNEISERLNEYILLKGLSFDEAVLGEAYQFLIAPFSEKLPANLVVIPDGTIGYVPFEMLMDQNNQMLIENVSISYAFEYITPENLMIKGGKPWAVYCLAPQYKVKEAKTNDVTRGSVYHLPYAKMEMDSIQRLFGESALTSQSSDKHLWSQHITQTRIFHYAGHAIIEGEKSYLALSDADDEKLQLTAYEIGLKHYPLDLAVLSACETGLGKMEQGEGIRSLGRSFMESGTRATVISLWNVNDKSTAAIMTGFYHYLLSGKSKSESLRLSKLDYMRTAPAANAHPYFWAAFIPAGDMTPLKIE